MLASAGWAEILGSRSLLCDDIADLGKSCKVGDVVKTLESGRMGRTVVRVMKVLGRVNEAIAYIALTVIPSGHTLGDLGLLFERQLAHYTKTEHEYATCCCKIKLEYGVEYL